MDARRRRSANNAKNTMQCGSILQELSAENTKTLKETAAQVMLRLSSFQWQIRTRGLTRHIRQDAKEYSQTQSIIISGKYQRQFQKVVQVDGRKTQTIGSACKKIAARTKTMETWDKVASGPRETQNDAQQRQAQFGKQWNVVQTTAGGSNTIP